LLLLALLLPFFVASTAATATTAPCMPASMQEQYRQPQSVPCSITGMSASEESCATLHCSAHHCQLQPPAKHCIQVRCCFYLGFRDPPESHQKGNAEPEERCMLLPCQLLHGSLTIPASTAPTATQLLLLLLLSCKAAASIICACA
jgi:hypothetical protein